MMHQQRGSYCFASGVLLFFLLTQTGRKVSAQTPPAINATTFEGFVLAFEGTIPPGKVIDMIYFPPVSYTLWKDSSQIPDIGSFYPSYDSIMPSLVRQADGVLTSSGQDGSLDSYLHTAPKDSIPKEMLFYQHKIIGPWEDYWQDEVVWDRESRNICKTAEPKAYFGNWALYKVKISGLSLTTSRRYQGHNFENLYEMELSCQFFISCVRTV